MGYSVGHWEGATLVVESNGYNDRTWLDSEGYPHSEGLRLTERFRRTDFGHTDLNVTFEDPAVYARPIQVDRTMQAVPDTEMLEFVCAENERDRGHITDEPRVELSAKELSEFVGTYTTPNPFGPKLKFVVSVSAGELTVDSPFGPMRFHATGKSSFSSRTIALRFVEENGVTAMIMSQV